MKILFASLIFIGTGVIGNGQSPIYTQTFEPGSPSYNSIGWSQFTNVYNNSSSFVGCGNPGNASITHDLELSFTTGNSTQLFLNFKHLCSLASSDGGTIWYSTDNGINWEQLRDHEGAVNNTSVYLGTSAFRIHNNDFSIGTHWVPDIGQIWIDEWFEFVDPIPAYTPVRIKFVTPYVIASNSESFKWYIDDVNIYDQLPCGLFDNSVPLLFPYLDPIVLTDGPYNLGLNVYTTNLIESIEIVYLVNGVMQNPVQGILGSWNEFYFQLPAFQSGDAVHYFYRYEIKYTCGGVKIDSPPGDFIYYHPCDYVPSQLSTNIECGDPELICDANKDLYFKHDFNASFGSTSPNTENLYYKIVFDQKGYTNILQAQASIEITPFDVPNYGITEAFLYGPFDCNVNWGSVCAATQTSCVNQIVFSTTSTISSYNGNLDFGIYLLVIKPAEIQGCFKLRVSTEFMICGCPGVPCEDCIGSFSPEPGKEYVLSAWAKEHGSSVTKTTYTDPVITITHSSCNTPIQFSPSGLIIDGWQRIEEKFTIPPDARELNLELKSMGGDVYFDDIRIYPFNGSMKSYVYDPVTRLFVAELDENNYATFYEYDEEGKLSRVKKETERGVMTIKEHRNNNPK